MTTTTSTKILGILTAMATTAVLGATGTGSAAAASAPAGCAQMQVAAHRGVHDARHTENTVRSAQLAVSSGADVLEGDMRLTRDQAWVMMHDPTVARTTNGRGRVSDLRYRQVKRLRTSDGVRGGVPSVNADLAVLDAHPGIGVQLEVKPGRVSWSALRRLLAIFTRHHLLNRLTITSFSTQPLAAIHRIDPRWSTSFLTYHRVDTARARSLGRTLSIEERALTSSYADALHSNGLEISVWKINSWSVWKRVVSYGADTLVTDRVAAVKQWCSSAG
jgi:glycerophosphoryl diester phosphodiesterase